MSLTMHKVRQVMALMRKVWHRLNGDHAYQAYLRHWHAHHADQQLQPLSRQAFFAEETRRKWNGVKRCC